MNVKVRAGNFGPEETDVILELFVDGEQETYDMKRLAVGECVELEVSTE